MTRRAIFFLIPAMLVATAVPGTADEGDVSPPDPRNRIDAWTPRDPGTRTTTVLQYGPYLIHPGSDLSRIDFEVTVPDGFVVAARPSVRLADGTEPPDEQIHIHHAHWVRIRDPQEWPQPLTSDYNDYLAWFFGTGEEKTRGALDPYSQADPRFASGLRYGVETHRGDKMMFVSMLHNKTASPMVVWLEGRFESYHGTRQQLAALGLDFHPLTPVLHGTTFQVPRTGGIYSWPRDVPAGDKTGTGVVAGVGHVWEAPWAGTIIIGAGHLHPGGKEVVVSNLGSPAKPCGSAYLDDPDADGFAGKTILRIQAYYQNGIMPSEDFQMGITQHGWRAKVRQGDRIAINGVYDTTSYAYPDAMSFFGFYADRSEGPVAGEECSARLINQPGADPADVVMSMPNRAFTGTGRACNPCDRVGPLPAKGQWTNVVNIAAFKYLPGDLDTIDVFGAPWVRKGETLRFVNQDWFAGLVRHSVTTCKAPCNGPSKSNYPFHDGVIDSGALGATPIDTYETTKDEPVWDLDTSTVATGYYAYYCRLHTWMRGSFYVEAV